MNHRSPTIGLSLQRATRGSRWFYGNFTLGLTINNHPRWLEIVIGLVFWDVIISVVKRTKEGGA